MGQIRNTSKLQHVHEHLGCVNYATDDQIVMKVVELEAEKLLIRKDLQRSVLVFIMGGNVLVTIGKCIEKSISCGNMFLVPAGGSCYIRATSHSVIMRCSFGNEMALCNKVTLSRLAHYATMVNQEQTFVVLPITEILFRELQLIKDVMDKQILCIHYMKLKMETIFLELRCLYGRDELSALFAPILGKDYDFKTKVLMTYLQAANARELAGLLNMSSSNFNRKFRDTFDISVGKWLRDRKKERIYSDILMTDTPISEIAFKYSFTVNHLIAFCKKHFGLTPTEMRKERTEEWNKEVF